MKIVPGAFASLSPGDRVRAVELLEEYERSAKRNPLQIYRPASPKHADFHASIGTPLRAFFGGNRAGKTTTGIVDDLIQVAPRELVPERLMPYKRWDCPCYIRVLAPDMERTMRPVIHHKLREWMPKDLLRNGDFDKSYDKKGESLQLECGCRFDFLSYEMDLNKFGGAALHRIHYDEEPPDNIRQECLMRLIDFNGDEMLTMTPLSGLTPFAYRKVWKRRFEPIVSVHLVTIFDNHHLSKEALDRTMAEIGDDEDTYKRRALGEFTHIGGMLYPDWNKCLVDAPTPDVVRDMDTVVGIDPGLRNAAIVWVGFDGDNNALIYDEVLLNDKTPADYAAAIRRTNRKWGVKDPSFVIDPSARNRSLTNAQSVEGELADCGIFCAHGQNDVEAGVQQIRRRIQRKALFVSKNCGGISLEAEEYRLEDREDGVFKVVKEKDHRLDALRYACMNRPWTVDDEPNINVPSGEAAFGPKPLRKPEAAVY